MTAVVVVVAAAAVVVVVVVAVAAGVAGVVARQTRQAWRPQRTSFRSQAGWQNGGPC